jgi:queuosine precursor transporter
MFPEFVQQYFIAHQDLLWLGTLCLDLGFTVLMYRIFGREGLIGCIVLSILLANLQGPKLTMIFGFQTTLGVIFYSSIFFATDLLSERWGREEANRAVMIGFFVSVIVVIMLSIALLFQPSTDPNTAEFSNNIQDAFETIVNFTPRFVFGSLLAYLISQNFDVYIFHKSKQRTKGKYLWLRNNASTMLSQTIDTLIYSLVVWWGVVDLDTALALGAVKYVFKLAIAAIDTPFIYWACSWKSGPGANDAGLPKQSY